MTLAQEGLKSNQKANSLANDLQELYEATKAKIGREDLDYIRHVAAYSKAIKSRSEELIQKGGEKDALKKGITLKALHILLEFSELGHNIMHGGYNSIPGVGEFHSDLWTWDFVTDPNEWKTMHHRNHHPYTNIVGKDHDLGYSFLRLLPNQDWFGHHGAQPSFIALFFLHMYHFTIYTATSAARVEGRKVLSLDTFKNSIDLIKADLLKSYVREPLHAKSRFFHTLLGNYAGTTLGYDLTILVLLLEHHAPNVELFADPGPKETQDEYYRRQILATTNFTPYKKLDDYFQQILEEEVDFENKPPFEIFYGGLATHLEHHLFPDLPCNRQREVAPEVKRICEAHDLPYNVIEFEEVVPAMFKNWLKWSVPVNEEEAKKPLSLLFNPLQLAKRVFSGFQYKTPGEDTYFKGIRYYNAVGKVIKVKPQINRQATSLSIKKPRGWESIEWDAGAYISVRFNINGEDLIRQYSLVNDSVDSDSLDITVKRVKEGRVSNYINDNIKRGSKLTIVGPPQNDGAFVMQEGVNHPVFIAGGVGITPILSMIQKLVREKPDKKSTLLYFNINEQSIIFEKEIRDLAIASNLAVHFICDEVKNDRGIYEQNTLSKKLLKDKIAKIKQANVYVCAPEGFIDASKKHLVDLGLTPENFHIERFTVPTVIRPKGEKSYTVRFLKSDKEVLVSGDHTLLEAAREAGLNPPAGCERGLCKACVCTKVKGRIKGERKKNQKQSRITICNSFPKSDLVLEL